MPPFTLRVFLSSLGDLWAFLPIYLPARAAANSNVPFSLKAKILEHYKMCISTKKAMMNHMRKLIMFEEKKRYSRHL